MEDIMGYVIGGVIALLVLFSLTPSILDQYQILNNETVSGGTQTYLEAAPTGVGSAIAAVLTIFFVLVLYTMYQEA